MKIAELFVNLGVKGADTAGKAVSGVKEGMGQIASSGLAAKAAIVGVMYGLQQLMSHSAKTGTTLSNFAALTGLSTKSLQQWQYAAKQVGVSADEITGSVKGVQSTMTNMLMGKGAPEGMAMVANKVGLDPKRFRDTFYMMQQLQKFAQSVPPDVANSMLKSFGLSEGTIAAMQKNAFNPSMLNKAPVYSDKEIGALSKVDAAWSNIGHKIEKTMGHMTARSGGQLVKDIDKLVTAVLKIVDALAKLETSFKVFEKIGKVLGFVADTITPLTDKEKAANIAKVEEMRKNPSVLQSIGGTVGAPGAWIGTKIREAFVSPNVAGKGAAPSGQNVEITQNLNFQHDGKDSKKTGDSVRQAAKESFRQIPAQAGGY